MNTDGHYGLSSESPAIDESSSTYPAILNIQSIDDDPDIMLDISGQSRPAVITLKDAGCDEYTSGRGTNKPLLLSDVGPFYLRGPVTDVGKVSSDQIGFDIYPNPASETVNISFEQYEASEINVVIYNMIGEQVKNLTISGDWLQSSSDQSFNVSDLKEGMYIMKIKTGRFSKALKLAIRR